MPRIFVAAFLPENIKKEVSAVIKDCKHIFHGIRWEKSSKLHITLKFIGNIDEQAGINIKNTVEKTAQQSAPLMLGFSHIDAFPDFRRPRVIVIRLNQYEKLLDLQNLLEDRLAEFGIKKEERVFVPHITIGRVKKDFRVNDKALKLDKKEFVIDQIGVVKSELKKEGSEYINLGVYKLS